MPQTTGRIEIFYNPKKAVGGLIFSLIFVAAGLFAALTADTWKPIVFGWLAVLLAPVLAVLSLGRMLRKTPALILDEKGLTDHTLKTQFFVPWQGIEAVYTANLGRSNYVGVVLKDQAAYLKTLSPAGQKMPGIRATGPVFIDMHLKTEDLERLIKQTQAKHAPPAPPILTNYPRT